MKLIDGGSSNWRYGHFRPQRQRYQNSKHEKQIDLDMNIEEINSLDQTGPSS